ncbi:Eco29kI family restriction endonuclease [Micromonospora salmantinae]|uniref:Eco29kI family restriction endonuclease n=1 Tax=Micromonospora salmantinae TaxID=2911211 RepID=UPI003557F337
MTDSPPPYFDPLSTEDLTTIICSRFERERPRSLANDLPRFLGSGLYAIYYVAGTDELYAPLADYKIPVYVGQSRSHNSATGKPAKTKDPLWQRVGHHRLSIGGAANLKLGDFAIRLLLLPDVHCGLGEEGLRVGYQPIWNAILTGFGSKEQGQTTRQSAKSKWDTVHPGRARTFGAEKHDAKNLRLRVHKRVAEQIISYSDLAWHR